MQPISKNQNRKTHRKTLIKVFNLALLALVLIIWSCSTTETTSSTPTTIELYSSAIIPFKYNKERPGGSPNTNILLSSFVKHPTNSLLLDFTVISNEYIRIETNTNSAEYSMLRVLKDIPGVNTNFVTPGFNSMIFDVTVSYKDNPADRTSLTLLGVSDQFGGLKFFSSSRRVVSGGCEVKFGALILEPGSTLAFNWFARFKPGDGVYNGSTNINLALVGLNGSGVAGVIPQANLFSGLMNTGSRQQVSPVTVSRYYTIVNNPVNFATILVTPWYSELTFTIPLPNDAFFAGTDDPYKANVRNGIAMRFLASTVTTEAINPDYIDHQCNTVN